MYVSNNWDYMIIYPSHYPHDAGALPCNLLEIKEFT